MSYDMVTGELMELPIKYSKVRDIGIYGSKVVWSHCFFGHFYDLNVCDMATGEVELLQTNKSNLFCVAIHGDNVVYVNDDIVYGNTKLSLFNLSTGTDRIVTNISDHHLDVDMVMHGGRVVWTEKEKPMGRSDLDGLTVYDLDSDERSVIVPSEYSKSNPAIYGRRVVWEDRRAPDEDIWMYDFLLKWEYPIVCRRYFQSEPAIYGTSVVWVDGRNISSRDQVDIYLYDIETEVEERLTRWNTSEEYWSSGPRIFGQHVVWTDYRNGNRTLYMLDLPGSRDTDGGDGGPDDGGDGGGGSDGTGTPLPSILEPSSSFWVWIIIATVVGLTGLVLYARKRKR